MSNSKSNVAAKTIETLNGKRIEIVSASIRVSKNEKCDGGIFTETRVVAKLPGGRKAHMITTSPFSGKIHVRPLYGYAAGADVAPEKWGAFVESLAVESCSIFPIELTADVIAEAKRRELDIVTCPAVTSPA